MIGCFRVFVQSVYSIDFYMDEFKAEIVHQHPNAATCVKGNFLKSEPIKKYTLFYKNPLCEITYKHIALGGTLARYNNVYISMKHVAVSSNNGICSLCEPLRLAAEFQNCVIGRCSSATRVRHCAPSCRATSNIVRSTLQLVQWIHTKNIIRVIINLQILQNIRVYLKSKRCG